MKTQISNLKSGTKNQVLNSNVDYSKLPKATSHNGHAGSNSNEASNVWERVKSENQEQMTIKIFGKIINLTANWSLSRKSVSYSAAIDNAFLEDHFMLKSTKNKVASISINHSTRIEVSNGQNSFTYVCPSLIEIL